jgi:bifunctional UDP-N-acetylglucosamine pyrophosphorylase/glucosamine-1-phosphate N-acetyltransferase
MSTAVILLAAGQGTRMNSDRPKVLHPLAGHPLLAHAMATARAIDPERVVVVTGHEAAQVDAAAREIDETVLIAHQPEQRGTGHAVLQTREALADFDGDVVVLYGDTPFIRPATLETMLAARAEGASVVVLGFETADPGRYGRLVFGGDGTLEEIVEKEEPAPGDTGPTVCNSGVVVADCRSLFELLARVEPQNAKGEYYLTAIVGLARARGLATAAIICPEEETQGVNSRIDLAEAEATFQRAARLAAMENGTTLTDPGTVWFALDTAVGRDVTIGPNVWFGPGVSVESGAAILGFCFLEGCHISQGAQIGPFARMRPGAEIAENAKVGNFVEIKNSIVDAGAKINHFSYIGDADVGARANVGAGTIVCNYDGVFKHRSRIGARAFIGSKSALVAPVAIGDDALVAAGSVITQDVPDKALALGRGRQVVKPGLGLKLMERLRALKTAKAGE